MTKLATMSGLATSPTYRVFLSLLAVVLVAWCAYLALSLRAVPPQDLWAFLFAVSYGLCFSFCTAPQSSPPAPPVVPNRVAPVRPLVANGRMRVQMLTLLTTSFFISVLIPACLILFVSEVTEKQKALLAPHLFCLCGQVVFELTCFRSGVNQLVRLAIPVLSTAYRFTRLLEWVKNAAAVVRLAGDNAPRGDVAMLALAGVNLAFWAIVLFYFLLLRVVPRYFAPPKPGGGSIKSSIAAEVQGEDTVVPDTIVSDAARSPLLKKQL